ncbi:hypothetical protein SAMN05192533_11516 [Mesobacillus persicus]|uniref:Uncharacterized protein n=1 Tax=Mesobacillus persicus TaxID=930146 RepID=A0A1H8HGN3_9BACI|nr:hypothetical protein [Mesobacillus persicus]SEN55363.1 hypothetical protein SAMN05192533_11516 [Mesobacillus persicus]
MQQYTGFFITLAIILIIVLFNKYLFWWVKGIIVAYYLVVSYYFITVKNRIDKEYEDILPVPDAYWDKNTGWVDTITNYLFLPLIAIVIFIYFKWFTKAQTKVARILILVSIIPATILLVFFSFLFSFGYGYRP